MRASKQIKLHIEALENSLLYLTNSGKMSTKEFCQKTETSECWFYNWRNGTKKASLKKILNMADKVGL